MVEGKGFIASTLSLSAYFAAITRLQTALECPLEPFRVPIRPRFRGAHWPMIGLGPQTLAAIDSETLKRRLSPE